MAVAQLQAIIRQVRHLLHSDGSGGLVDADLLERFVTARDEAAFEVLLWRHGPMVLGVCRRLLRQEADIEDAFQATFLALARKAGSIGQRPALAGWLYRVAYRVALDARTLAARRSRHEQSIAVLPDAAAPEDVPQQVARRELHALLDAEIRRLPRKYREAVVLCHLEGKTQEEAAQELGWAKGTVSTRLIHARTLLRRRLHRHGEALSGAVLVPALLHPALPPGLLQPTLRAALAFRAPATATRLVSARAAVLAEGMLRTLTVSRGQLTALVLLLASLGTGAGWLGYRALQVVVADEAARVEPPPAAPDQAAGPGPAAPLRQLDPSRIPPEDRFAWQPPELVAVLGEHRGRSWDDVLDVAFRPDGKQLASCGSDLAIRLWDVATLREQAPLKQHTQQIRCLAYSPDGKMLASGSDDKSVVLWDLTADPSKVRAVLKLSDWVPTLAFTPDGTALVCGEGKGAIRFWKVADGQAPEQGLLLQGPQDYTRCLGFSRDGKTLASAGGDGTIVLWDLATRTQQAQVKTNLRQLFAVTFSPDGKTLACCGDELRNRVYATILWDVTERTRPRELAVLKKHTHQVFAVKFAPDGKTLATGSGDGTVRLWSLAGTAPAEQAVIRADQWVTSLDFSPDGQTLVTGDRNGMVRLWDVTRPVPAERFTPRGHLGRVSGFVLTRTNLLASCGSDATLRLWDLAASPVRERSTFRGKGWMGSLSLSRDGKTLALDTGATLEVWDLSGEQPRTRLQCRPHKTGQVSGIGCVQIAPDGKTLLTSGVDGKLRFWDLTPDTPTEQRHLEVPGSSCVPVFADDGRLAAVAVYGRTYDGGNPAVWQPAPTVHIWDFTRDKPRETAALRHERDVSAVTFSPDGQTLATGGGVRISNQNPTPGEVRLWRLNDPGTEKRWLPLEGATDAIHCVTFSPDGQTLAAAGWRGQVILWETATGKKYKEWQLPGMATCLDFTADGRHLITANANGTLYVLRLGQGVPAAANAAALWETLATAEVAQVYPAVWALVAAPRQTLALFKDRLEPAAAVDPQHLQQLIDRLNDNRFAERQKATAALELLHERAEPALRRKLAEPSLALEMRQRLERLLEKRRPLPPETLRTMRAVQVLEQIGDCEAQQILQRLAQGAPDARETRQAQGALERLAERTVPLPR